MYINDHELQQKTNALRVDGETIQFIAYKI